MGAITNQLVEPRRGSLKVRFAAGKAGELRDSAMRHLSEMRRLLAKPENIGEARAVLAERVGSFTLSPAWNGVVRRKAPVDFLRREYRFQPSAGGVARAWAHGRRTVWRAVCVCCRRRDDVEKPREIGSRKYIGWEPDPYSTDF